MNSLSWFIYLAGMVNWVGNFMVFFLIAGLILTIPLLITYIFVPSHEYYNDGFTKQSHKKLLSWIFAAVVFLCIARGLIPDRQTVILIAASEIGERVVTSQQVAGVVDPTITYVREWLQTEIIKMQRDANRNNNNNNR